MPNEVNQKVGVVIEQRISTLQKVMIGVYALAGLALLGTFSLGVVAGIEALTGPRLRVTLASDTPPSQNVVRGTTDFEMVKFNFTTGPKDILVDAITLHLVGENTEGNIMNLKLFSGEEQIGPTFGIPVFQEGKVTIRPLNWKLLKNTVSPLSVKVDIALTGASPSFTVTAVTLGLNPQEDLVAYKVNSGKPVKKVRPNKFIQGNLMSIVDKGTLKAFLGDGCCPPSQNISMGEEPTFVYFTIRAEAEGLNLRSVTISREGGQDSDLSDLKLFDAARQIQIGQTAATLMEGQATFTNLDFFIPKGEEKNVSIQAKVNPYPTATSGDKVKLGIGNPHTDIEAAGEFSGALISADSDAPLYGNPYSIYRTEPVFSLSTLSPSGQQAPSTDQVVAIFRVKNTPTSGNYHSIIKLLNFRAETNFVAQGERYLKVYHTVPGSSNHLVATHKFSPGTPFGDTAIGEGEFVDLEIPGDNTTLYVTLDTLDANSPVETEIVRVKIKKEGLVWSDGVTSEITEVDSLEILDYLVSGYTLTY